VINRILPYLFVFLLMSWSAEKQPPPVAGIQKAKAEMPVCEFNPVTSKEAPGKTIHRKHNFLVRMQVSSGTARPPVLFLGEMDFYLATAGFREPTPVIITHTGLEKVYFRHLYPSHYFW